VATIFYSSTAKGRRAENQDRVCTLETGILAVADGMGGLEAGERAAEIAIGAVKQYVHSESPHDGLVRIFQETNRSIWNYGRQNGLTGGIGTTLVVCLALDNRYLVANAGDSRCYYINNFEAWQITEDHSRVQEMVRVGAMTPQAARQSPFRNELTNCLGEPHDISVDVFPHGNHWGVIDEDCVLLLCSDGLHGWVTDAEIFRTLHSAPHLKAGCDALIELAINNGSTDNASVAAAELGRLARRKSRVFHFFGTAK
jgi:serine/threonine protein phosphatase PrpC